MSARFFVDSGAVAGDRLTLGREDSRHLLTVLRSRPGDRFVAVAGGSAYEVELVAVAAGLAVGRVLARGPAGGEPPVAVTLYQGLAKGDKMEQIIQKATELGVARVVPVSTDRAVVQLAGERAEVRVERWQRVAREAAQQCRRGAVPLVEPVLPWAEAAARAGGYDLALLPWEAEAAAGGLRAALAALDSRPASLAVYVGPEGGLTAAEVALARAAGARAVGLGPRILRTETAGPALLAVLMFALGDLG